MKEKLLLIIFSVIIGSCQKNMVDENIILVRKTTEPNNLSIVTPHIIHLKENPHAQIGTIDKIIPIKNNLIILDKLIGNAVFIYDNNGDYVNHIHNIGEGPGEYKNIENIFYNVFTNELEIIPMDFKKKIFFSINGTYLREEFYKNNLYYSDLELIKNGEIIINNSSINGEDNIIVNINNALKYSSFPYNPDLDNSPLDQRNVISKGIGDNYLLSIGLRDTLYNFDLKNLTIKPKYILDFENEISFIEINKKSNPINSFRENDILVGSIDLFQNKNFISFSTLHNSGLKGRVYSKNSNFTYSVEEIIKEKLGDLNFQGILGVSEDNKFIAVLSINELGKWDFSKDKLLKKQFDQFKNVDKEDFILLFFDLKEIP